jgi:hypothetical protein
VKSDWNGTNHILKEQDNLDDTAPWPQNWGCWNTDTCSNNIMDYNSSEHSLSAWQIGRIHAFLMNLDPGQVWQALEPDHCTYHASEKITIDSGEIYTWKGEKWLKGDLVIKKGGSLTIQCKVSLPKDARVTVEGGGKFTLDGGTLTNVCNDLWKGVYVLGDNTKPQSDTLAQGRIIMKNGAVIEQANNAVTLVDWDANGPIWTTTGGIIQADSSYFLNNVRAIAFMSYQNKVGNLELNNASSITHCRFEINQALKNGRLPYAFITMFDVKNVKLWGNHFINTHYDYAQAGMGIYTEFTTLRVNSPDTLPNIFENLECGIRVNEFNSMHQTVIKKAEFINNYGGVHLMNTAYAVVTENKFEIKGYDSTMTAPCGTPDGYHNSYGIHLAHSDRYKVEANGFTTYDSLITSGYPDAFDNQTGIIVSNSGTGGNQIYRNTFHDLIVGNKAQGVNGLPLSQVGVGLEYKCNNFSGEIFKAAIGVTPKGRIAYRQGWISWNSPFDSKNPAGNEFHQITSRTPLDTMMDIWYNELDEIIYTHHTDAYCIPRKFQMGSVLLQQAPAGKDSLACPSNLLPVITGGGGSSRSANPLSEFIELRDSAQSILDGLHAAAHDTLREIVEVESPSQAYSTLEPFMPLLSDKILNQVAYNAADTLAPEYFDILLLHSPLSDAVWENMAAIPFDSAQAAQLMAAQAPLWSVRDSAYLLATDLVMERDLLRNDEIRWWLEEAEEDTLSMENIITLLKLCPTMESKIHLTDLYIKQGLWEETESLLDSIESVEDYAWLPFVRVQEYLLSAYTRAGSLKTRSSDTDLQASLETHIGNDVMGKGKLIAVNNIIFSHPPCPEAYALVKNEDNPPAERKGLIPISSKTYSNQFKIYPNPASGSIIVLPDFEEKIPGEIQIKDLQGRTLIQKKEVSSGVSYTLPIHLLSPGIYLVEFHSEGRNFVSKLIKE